MYTPAIAQLILDALAEGKTLRSICRDDPDLPSHPTVLRWVQQDTDGFAQKYREAREIGFLQMADELVELSDAGGNDPGAVARARLMVDTRKFLLSKALPKIYGDRVTIAGDADAPLKFEDNRPSIAELLAQCVAEYEASRGPRIEGTVEPPPPAEPPELPDVSSLTPGGSAAQVPVPAQRQRRPQARPAWPEPAPDPPEPPGPFGKDPLRWFRGPPREPPPPPDGA